MTTYAKVFPIATHAYSHGSYVQSPGIARSLWLPRRGDITWYCVDAVLHADCVVVIVYDMLCNVYGGIGKRIHEISVPLHELSEEERAMYDELVDAAKYRLAVAEYERRERACVETEIRKVLGELFGESSCQNV